MEPAIFVSAHGAKRIMGCIPWFRGRSVKTVPYYRRGMLEGYKVLLNGKPLTERAVEVLQAKGV